jgi:hypothetical protein
VHFWQLWPAYVLAFLCRYEYGTGNAYQMGQRYLLAQGIGSIVLPPYSVYKHRQGLANSKVVLCISGSCGLLTS